MIHDCQYNEEDRSSRTGWGHSFFEDLIKVSELSRVKHLVLFHHDPERSDVELEALQSKVNNMYKNKEISFKCTVAKEGLTLNL